jgi:hypothetical protein
MENLTVHIIAVLSAAFLCGGWVAVQVLARRMKTKNHFDDLDSCGACSCGGVPGACVKAKEAETADP